MSKRRAHAFVRPPASEAPFLNPELYTQIAFALTLALVIARAMMTEPAREAVDAVIGGMGAPRSAGAGGSLFLDALCAVPAILVLLRRIFDSGYVIRWTWSCVFVAALAIWATASVAWSTDKFLTLVNAGATVASALLIWSSMQLVRSWLRLRIIAGVCLGLLLVYTASGLTYKLLDVPDNVKYWNEHKAEILREHGWEADSPSAIQFEGKLTRGEMIGFNTSPNSFAAVLVMLIVISGSLVIQRMAGGSFRLGWLIGAIVLGEPALLVLKYSGAKTAVGTLALSSGALALLASSRVRAVLATKPARVYWVGVVAFFIGVAALVGHGVYHGSLPQDSLNFRWWYWTAAAKLVKQYPVLGVGWGNFGEPYLSVRLPVASEEVRDPHNFLVRSFAELGIVGGLIALAWFMRSAWEITRAQVPQIAVSGGKKSALLFAIGGIVAGVLLNVGMSIDFNQPSGFLILETFRRLLAMGLLTLGVLVASVGSGGDELLDTRPAPWVLYGLIIGLGAFFVHNLVEFVLSEPGPLTLFSVLLGAAIGLRTQWTVAPKPTARKPIAFVTIGSAIAWLIVIGMLVIPIADADARARDGDDAIRAGHPDQGAAVLSSAFKTVPYNTDYAFRTARALAYANDKPERVKAMLELAAAADRRSVAAYLMLANIAMHQQPADGDGTRVNYDSALAIDPQNVLARLDYAAALEKLGDGQAAAKQYRLALATNDAYHLDEPRRLTAARVAEIEKKISELSR